MLNTRITIFILVLVFLCNSAQVIGDEKSTRTVFPIGELFEPLVADVKEPQFSTGIHRVKSSGRLGELRRLKGMTGVLIPQLSLVLNMVTQGQATDAYG